MLCSLNEIETQVRKAVRGAGYEWGLAEEAAKAARWLALHGHPAIALFLGLCERFDRCPYAERAPAATDGVWCAPGGVLCPLVAGAALGDFAPPAVETGPMAFPLIYAAFAAGAGYALEGGVDPGLSTVERTVCRHVPAGGRAGDSVPLPDGIEVDAALWARLDCFARRTYVPASAVSRLTGAGAGTMVDND